MRPAGALSPSFARYGPFGESCAGEIWMPPIEGQVRGGRHPVAPRRHVWVARGFAIALRVFTGGCYGIRPVPFDEAW
jgi:hypothetical protein